jgi:signal transduction histidine kinase/putative methionine-R-sulfoxide reductase with GAF domain
MAFSQGNQYLITMAFLILSLLICSFTLGVIVFLERIRGKSPLVTRHSEHFVIALLASFTPLTIQCLVNWINHTIPPIHPVYFFPLIILPATLIRVSRKFRIPEIKKSAFQFLILIIITVLFGLFYTGLVYGINHILIVKVSPDNPMLIGSLVLIVTLLLNPLHRQVNKLLGNEPGLDDQHLKKAMDYTATFTSISTKKDAFILLGDATWDIIESDKVNIALYDQKEGGYTQYSLPGLQKMEGPAIPKESPISTTLTETKSHLYLRANSHELGIIRNNADHISEDFSYLYIPIWGNFGLMGWIETIDQRKKFVHTDEDIQLLKSLTSQFTLVIERIDTIESLQQRLGELEILNQIALTVNNLSDLDNLLSAILRHIQKVVTVDRLSLVLKDPLSEDFKRYFLLQEDEILISTKNPSEIKKDYPEKLETPPAEPVFIHHNDVQWLVIPLNHEKELLGFLSLGSSGADNDQNLIILNLASPIANLVLTAINKSNLMDALQEKMRHLERLNAVSQQLTSTLNIEMVLQRIVDSASEILHAESGSILSANDQKDELVIRIATGEEGALRLGRIIPITQAIAGEAYADRHSIICNENVVERMIIWEDLAHTTYTVKNILAVPLIVQEEAIGVLEVFNKEKGLPFTEKDAAILEGFAAQAAIALNNASQYAKADLALEKRIDELTTMQQIDKALHSSRGLSESLQTTLNSALTYTKVKSGSIMLVDTYYHEIDDIWQKLPGEEQCTPYSLIEISNFPWFSEELDDPYQIIFEDPGALSEQLGLENNYQAHLMITSKLEDDLYSLLILHLEEPNTFNEQDVDFLLGLNNHAMIALRNSILYEDLNNAINAKNEFISFISHELKNPLTAIKGHADILAKGMVGEVNPEQEDFLKTISHNVRRMSTFITDLSDQSHIESKSLRFVFDSADVVDMVNEVLQSFGQQIKGKSLKISQNFPSDLPQVWCDRQRMIQILANLISNAIKYTPDDGAISISAEQSFNDWDPKGPAEVVHISVQDTGYGIAYEDQPHLFNKFFRGTNEKILKISGTGLGLRISKSLAEMMGGTMWFESTPGEGSIFHFTVPI